MPTPAVKGPRWPPPRRGDVLAVALMAAIVLALLVVGARKSAMSSLNGSNPGSGPIWNAPASAQANRCAFANPAFRTHKSR
jgi:hypothetical protein